jgi:GTPase KRas
MTEFKVVILGGGGIGKSALVTSFISNHFIEAYDPTIEDAYRKQVRVDDEVCLLDILDTAGQEEYSAMRDQYVRHGEGFVLVFDLTSRASLEELPKMRDAIYRAQDADPATNPIPMVLVGNKSDLEPQRQVMTWEGQETATRWGCNYIETSARTRTNVDELFFDMVRAMRAPASPDKKDKKKGKKFGKKECRIL